MFKQPLVSLRPAAIAVDHYLLRHAAHVRAEHRVQPHHRATVHRQHRMQRTIFHRRQIHQNAVVGQRWQAAYHLLCHMNRHADDHHAGVGQQLFRLRPIFLIQYPDLITRQRQRTVEQPAHLAVAADDDDRPQLRAQGLKPLSFSLTYDSRITRRKTSSIKSGGTPRFSAS